MMFLLIGCLPACVLIAAGWFTPLVVALLLWFLFRVVFVAWLFSLYFTFVVVGAWCWLLVVRWTLIDSMVLYLVWKFC